MITIINYNKESPEDLKVPIVLLSLQNGDDEGKCFQGFKFRICSILNGTPWIGLFRLIIELFALLNHMCYLSNAFEYNNSCSTFLSRIICCDKCDIVMETSERYHDFVLGTFTYISWWHKRIASYQKRIDNWWSMSLFNYSKWFTAILVIMFLKLTCFAWELYVGVLLKKTFITGNLLLVSV